MLTKNVTNQMINDVYTLLAQISDPKEMEILLKDLCTNKEIEQMAQRITAAKLLLEGKKQKEEIDGK